MNHTKQTLLSIAIIAALPFTVNAAQTIIETNTPAAVGANGTVKKAAATGPYQTATIGEHDDEHIATTAYVKGAYNDAIAAVNKVGDAVDFLVANFETRQARLGLYDPEEDDVGTDISPAILESLSDVTSSSQLVNGMAVKNAIDAQRVEIYTTWDDDDTAEVALITAQQ